MFKRFLATLAFCVVALGVTPAHALPFDLGFRVGMNLANVAGPTYEDNRVLPGVQVAITGQFKTPRSLPFKVIAELMYSQQGTALVIPGDNIRVNLDYAAAALLVRVYILPPPLRPYITAGAQAGYAVNRTTVIGDGNPRDLDAIRAPSAGVTGGLGLRIRQFGVELYGEVRYFRDLVNIANADELGPLPAGEDQHRLHNSVGTISAGVRF
jgi:hypothetical protein